MRCYSISNLFSQKKMSKMWFKLVQHRLFPFLNTIAGSFWSFQEEQGVENRRQAVGNPNFSTVVWLFFVENYPKSGAWSTLSPKSKFPFCDRLETEKIHQMGYEGTKTNQKTTGCMSICAPTAER